MFNDAMMLLASEGNAKRGARLKQRSNDRLGFNEEKELLSIHKDSFFLFVHWVLLFTRKTLLSFYNTKSFSMPNPCFKALLFFLPLSALLRAFFTFCLVLEKLGPRQRTGCRYLASK